MLGGKKALPKSYNFKPLFGSSKSLQGDVPISSRSPILANPNTIPSQTPLPDPISVVRVEEVDDGQSSIPKKRKSWKELNASRGLRTEWLTQFWWVEKVDGLNGKVKCKVFKHVEKRPKILDCKLDTLEKHEGK